MLPYSQENSTQSPPDNAALLTPTAAAVGPAYLPLSQDKPLKSAVTKFPLLPAQTAPSQTHEACFGTPSWGSPGPYSYVSINKGK